MVYEIRAVVGVPAVVAALNGPAVDLACGLALCPMTDDVLARLGCDRGGGDVFDFLPAELVDLLLEVSASGPVAYLEAELFGGYGTQAAAVWDRYRLVAGPTRYDFEAPDARPRSQWPFNMALRRLGVRATVTSDEFDIAGLGRHRTTDAWVRRPR